MLPQSMPKGPKCKSLGAIRKKSLLCTKSAILSIRWKFPFSEGWGGSLKKVLILVQRPQHKSTSDPVGAPKNNPFGAIFIEFGDTKKCCTFSGLELVPKTRKKLIAALSCMRKGPKCIQTLWDHPKKFLLCKSTKKSRYARSLGKKPHFQAFPEAKKVLHVLRCAKNAPQRSQKMQIPWGYQKKKFIAKVESLRFCQIRWKFQFSGVGWVPKKC